MKEIRTFVTTDAKTGEVFSTNTLEVKPGSGIKVTATSEDQRNAYKGHQEDIEEMREAIDDAYFHLIFKYRAVIFKELEEKVPGNKNNIHIIRFIVLASYQTFGGNLLDKNRNRIKKSSLKKIWDTDNRNGINESYKILKECGYIYETEEGYIMINEDMVIKGEIKKFINELKKQNSNYTYRRIYSNNVQDMYYGTESKQRKQLANLFKILPYINYKYNVFCSNPAETDETKLELLNWTDLAKLCGYDETKVTRFKKDLKNLSIDGRSVIGQFETRAGSNVIVVNPAIHYGGIDINDVNGIKALFDLADGKKNK